MDVFLIICVTIVAIITILFIAYLIVEYQSGLTNKRKEKYLKNKEKQIIEQLEFEKGVFVRKVKIEKRMYGYVYFTNVYAWVGKIYPQVFETLDELVEHIKKLEQKGLMQYAKED